MLFRSEPLFGADSLFDGLPWWRAIAEHAEREDVMHELNARAVRMPRHFVFGTEYDKAHGWRMRAVRTRKVEPPRRYWFALYFGHLTANARGFGQGGAIAAAFDGVMSYALAENGPVVTLTLNIAYRNPVPVEKVSRRLLGARLLSFAPLLNDCR